MNAEVTGRYIVPGQLGNGERLYEHNIAKGTRKVVGFKVPEDLVLKHEHIHILISAHVASRLEEFARKAFGVVKLS